MEEKERRCEEEPNKCGGTLQLSDGKKIAYVSRWVEEQARLTEVHEDYFGDADRNELDLLNMMRKDENCHGLKSTKVNDGRDTHDDDELQQIARQDGDCHEVGEELEQDIYHHIDKFYSRKRGYHQSQRDPESLPNKRCKISQSKSKDVKVDIRYRYKKKPKNEVDNRCTLEKKSQAKEGEVGCTYQQKKQMYKSKQALYKQMFFEQEELKFKDRVAKATKMTESSNSMIFYCMSIIVIMLVLLLYFYVFYSDVFV